MWPDFLKGRKIKCQELRAISDAAAKAGLLGSEVPDSHAFRFTGRKPNTSQFNFPTETDPCLALTNLHSEIELRLRDLAGLMGLHDRSKGTKQILRDLLRSGALTDQEFAVLRNLITTLDRATKGAVVEAGCAEWVAEIGPRLLATLRHHPLPPDLSEFGL